MKNYSVFLILILLSACQQPAKNKEDQKKADAGRHTNDLAAHLKDSLVLDVSGNAFESRVSLISSEKGAYNLAVFKVQNGSLRLYNIDKSISRFIGWFPEEKANFFVQADTVFAWVKQTKSLDVYLVKDRKCRKLKTLTFPEQGKDKRFKFDVYPADIPFTLNDEGEAIFETLPRLFHVEDSTLYFQTTSLASFQLKKDTIVLKEQWAPYPAAYRKSFIGGSSQMNSCIKNGDTVSYIYQDAPFIYEYNQNTGKLCSFPIAGLPVNTISKYDCSQSASFQYDRVFSIENNWYIKMLYDIKHDLYIVFRARQIPINRSDGTLAEWDDKPVDIFVVGKDKRVLRTHYLSDQHKYFIYQSFIYDGCLYMVRNINNNEDHLIADKYEL